MIPFPSLNWLRVGLVASVLALLASGIFAVHHNGVAQGRAEVQAKWDGERLEQAAAKAAQDALDREKEQVMQAAADDLRRTFNEKTAQLSGDLDAARAANRLLRAPRPANYTAPGPAAEAASPRASCSGASLFAEDADFALREAARADGLRLAYLRCEAQYNAARDTLMRLEPMGTLVGTPEETVR